MVTTHEVQRAFIALKTFKYLSVLVLFLLFQATLAGAVQTRRYDIAYTWENDIQRVLDYRDKLARVLGLTIDNQLKIVGRGNEYGVICTVKGSLAQTKKTAEKQTRKLRQAGLKPAHPTESAGYHGLYNVSYTSGPNLEILKKDFSRITSSLGRQVGAKLFIEKSNSRNFTLVYRCWVNKSSALRFARQHGSLLKNKKISATILSAVNRPVVRINSIIPGKTDMASDRKGSQPVQPRIVEVKYSTKKRTASPLARIAEKQGRSEASGQNRARVQSLAPGSATGLISRMDAFLQGQKKKGRIRNERTAWVAYDLTRNTYLVNINSNRPFQAASMIKPFVAVAFFHQVDKGKLSYTPQHRRMMEAMIQQSDNQATNWFIRQVGGPAKCEIILKKEYSRFFKQVKIKEYIPPGGRTYKNCAPPSEYIQFLCALWNRQLPHSDELLRVMSLPGRDRICSGTKVPPGTLVYNKTGSTAHLIGDMGILAPRDKNGRRVPYAIVGIVEGPSKAADYKQWMHSSGAVIRDFSTLVYEEMKQKHNLL